MDSRVPSVVTTCWQPYVKGYVRASNGLYTHNNMEDAWMDR
ncbi:MAG TPA: hypothetical protein VLN59_11570 [Burkholderiales bacterium]|nr:hypothetical protein [Burkholderiales bacterium]